MAEYGILLRIPHWGSSGIDFSIDHGHGSQRRNADLTAKSDLSARGIGMLLHSEESLLNAVFVQFST